MKNSRKPGKGSFANAYKGPPSKQNLGLNWDQVREQYYDRMRDQVARGVQDAETAVWRDNELHLLDNAEISRFLEHRAIGQRLTRSPQARSMTPEDNARGGRRRGPLVDVDRMVELYEAGTKPDDIAKLMGHAVFTVRAHLKKRGVWDPGKFKRNLFTGKAGPGPEQKTVCSRGHDLTAEGATKQLWKYTAAGPVKNGRACVRCWGGPS